MRLNLIGLPLVRNQLWECLIHCDSPWTNIKGSYFLLGVLNVWQAVRVALQCAFEPWGNIFWPCPQKVIWYKVCSNELILDSWGWAFCDVSVFKLYPYAAGLRFGLIIICSHTGEEWPSQDPVWPHQQCIAHRVFHFFYHSQVFINSVLFNAMIVLDKVVHMSSLLFISYPKGLPPWKPRADSFSPFWAEILCSYEPAQTHGDHQVREG